MIWGTAAWTHCLEAPYRCLHWSSPPLWQLYTSQPWSKENVWNQLNTFPWPQEASGRKKCFAACFRKHFHPHSNRPLSVVWWAWDCQFCHSCLPSIFWSTSPSLESAASLHDPGQFWRRTCACVCQTCSHCNPVMWHNNISTAGDAILENKSLVIKDTRLLQYSYQQSALHLHFIEVLSAIPCKNWPRRF